MLDLRQKLYNMRDGMNIMIENERLEQPPQATDRDQLANG